MKGILRGLNLDPSNGLPEGLSIERMKDGQPTGEVKFFSSSDVGAAWEKVKESLSSLKKDQQIDYRTVNYKPIEVGPAGTLNKGKGGGGWGQPKSPEERRSIELQSCLRTVADVYIAALANSGTPTRKEFPEMVDTIWAETLKIADRIREQSKGA